MMNIPQINLAAIGPTARRAAMVGAVPIVGGVVDAATGMMSGESAGEAAAGAFGSTAGAALGSMLGPVGTVAGGIAGGYLADRAHNAVRGYEEPEKEGIEEILVPAAATGAGLAGLTLLNHHLGKRQRRREATTMAHAPVGSVGVDTHGVTMPTQNQARRVVEMSPIPMM